jgi:hypothetical protein
MRRHSDKHLDFVGQPGQRIRSRASVPFQEDHISGTSALSCNQGWEPITTPYSSSNCFDIARVLGVLRLVKILQAIDYKARATRQSGPALLMIHVL